MARATILVIEDNPSLRELLRLTLEAEGYVVAEAADGVSALAFLDREQPDLVIQDLVLPDIDGIELTQRIRATRAGKTVPIVIVSGFVGRLEEVRALHDEYVEVLVKPVTRSKLVETVRAHLPRGPGSEGEHSQRLIQRLERHVTVQSTLEQRYAVQSAELALLGGIADALTRSANTDATLRDIFAATLDAAGISSGALFLTTDDGTQSLRHAIGYDADDGVEGFFGASVLLANTVKSMMPVSLPSVVVPGNVSRALLATAKVASMQIVPIVLDGKGVGALVLGSRANDLPSEGVVAFARAIGAQIAQSLALIRAFEQRKVAEAALVRANDELEHRVQERTAELERSVQRHRDMLAFVSHDLRNPLSTICLGAEQLGESAVVGNLTPITARIVGRMTRVAMHMRTLIDGLVDFASIEEGALSLEPRVASIRTLVDDALELNSAIANAKSIKLELVGDCDGRVVCDVERILQVFTNLLGNAIKFSPTGSVVSLTVKSVGATCHITVTDQGCGIQPEHLDHVFDRYWHLPGTGRRGSGLGLAIAKGVIEAHGGKITAESVSGKGSSFRFTLTHTAKAEPARPEGVDAGKLARRVLVVDDDPFLRVAVAELLAGAGFVVYQACDGAAALTVLATETADLILLDLQMPNMGGDDFLRARSLDAALARIPVVMLSATATTVLDGVAALVRKPFTVNGLLDAINLHCGSPLPTSPAAVAAN